MGRLIKFLLYILYFSALFTLIGFQLYLSQLGLSFSLASYYWWLILIAVIWGIRFLYLTPQSLLGIGLVLLGIGAVISNSLVELGFLIYIIGLIRIFASGQIHD